MKFERDLMSSRIGSEMAERIPDGEPMSDDAFDALKDKLISIFEDAYRAQLASTWDEGWDACADWWEIHHHRVVADEKNPYRGPRSVSAGS